MGWPKPNKLRILLVDGEAEFASIDSEWKFQNVSLMMTLSASAHMPDHARLTALKSTALNMLAERTEDFDNTGIPALYFPCIYSSVQNLHIVSIVRIGSRADKT